jgi:hypothetical protein
MALPARMARSWGTQAGFDKGLNPRTARTELSVPRLRRLRTALPASQEDQHLRVLAGQKFGVKEIDDGIWLASFMHYDLGYFDLEQKTLQPLGHSLPSTDKKTPLCKEQIQTPALHSFQSGASANAFAPQYVRR